MGIYYTEAHAETDLVIVLSCHTEHNRFSDLYEPSLQHAVALDSHMLSIHHCTEGDRGANTVAVNNDRAWSSSHYYILHTGWSPSQSAQGYLGRATE